MNSILSVFITAVVEYLLTASIAAVVLVAVSWGLIKVRRVEGPANRHMMWLFTLLVIVLLPGMWLHGPKLGLSVLPSDSSPVLTAPQPGDIDFTGGPMEKNVAGASLDLPVENAASKVDAAPSFRLPPITTLSVIGWSIGFLLMLIRLTVGGGRLRRLLRTADLVPDAIELENGRRRRIDLRLTSKVDCPVCCGLLRTVILMPKKIFAETSPEDLRMILRHELAHIERKDCWINLFQRFVEAVLFFHPLVWYASFQLTQQREELCDQHVIAGGASPENYAEMLGRIARQGFEKRTLHAVALFEGRLLSRVKSLLTPRGRVQIRASRKAIGFLAVAAMLCLAVGTVRLEAQSNTETASDALTGAQDVVSFRPQEETLGPDDNRPRGTSALSGWVTSAVTGDPIEEATVYLFYTGTNDAIFIKVASDGSFSFDDIPDGEYSLNVINTPGFQDAAYSPGNNSMGGEMLLFFSLAAGEERSGIVFELEPLPDYSISGKIVGEDGQPVKDGDLVVRALQKQDNPMGGAAQYQSNWSAIVASDGSYRLDNLNGDPVWVMVQAGASPNGYDQPYPRYYYPGTVSRDQAEMVVFDGGKSRENIDIKLVRNSGAVLEGIVTDEVTGAPIANAIVVVNHSDMLDDFMSTRTDEKGCYRIENVSAGELLAHVDARTSGYVRARQPVTLEDGETARLDVALKTGAFVSGVFVDESGDPINVSMNAYGSVFIIDPVAPGGGGNMTSLRWSIADSDNREEKRPQVYSLLNGQGNYPTGDMMFPTEDSFSFEAILPGETHLRFFPQEQGMEVKKILYHGKNIMADNKLPADAPPESLGFATIEAVLETHSGENVEDLSIVLGPVVNSSSP